MCPSLCEECTVVSDLLKGHVLVIVELLDLVHPLCVCCSNSLVLFMCCLTQLVKYALIKREIPNSHSLTEMYTQTHGVTHTHVQIHTHTLASLTHTQ